MSWCRRIALYVLAAFYGVAGLIHLAYPAPFIHITPGWVPQPALVVAMTGTAEIAGSLGLLQPRFPALRRAAGWGLALYALCVWPANYNHMLIDMARPDHGAGLGYHLPRLAAQPLIIWLALWVSGVTDWPWRRR
ncbi:MAG: DoxX family protein [Novosphingobium sp.]